VEDQIGELEGLIEEGNGQPKPTILFMCVFSIDPALYACRQLTELHWKWREKGRPADIDSALQCTTEPSSPACTTRLGPIPSPPSWRDTRPTTSPMGTSRAPGRTSLRSEMRGKVCLVDWRGGI
jgi:hypothetical protein